MAANTYGVTYSTVQQFFPSAIPFAAASRVDDALVTSWIANISEDLRADLYPAMPNDADITTTQAPVAYGFMSRLLALGVAIKIAQLGGGADTLFVEQLIAEFDEKRKRLRDAPRSVLSDLSTFNKNRGGTVSLDR